MHGLATRFGALPQPELSPGKVRGCVAAEVVTIDLGGEDTCLRRKGLC